MSWRRLRVGFACCMAATVVSAACGGDGDDRADNSTTSATSPTTTDGPSSTTEPPLADVCESGALPDDRYEVDIDGVAPDEVIYLRLVGSGADPDPPSFELGACGEAETLSRLVVEGTGLEILGFVDLGDDQDQEVLLIGEGERGVVVQAATVTLRGLALTDLSAERWIDGGGSPLPDTPFDAAGFECDDIDDDGNLELLITSFRPADDLVHINVAIVGLDGLVATSAGLDAYETDVDQALERWSRPDRCTPGSPPRVEVDYGANGWGRLDFGDAFASDGNVVLTGVARGGPDDRYVAVGAEQPSFVIGEFFPPRPVIWSSLDAITWVKSDLGDAEGELHDVASLPDGDGFVAVGRTGSSTAAAWLSADGQSWDLVEVPLAREGVGTEGPVMSQVVAGPMGLVAVGTEDYAPSAGFRFQDIDAAVWLSADGRAWERIEDPSLGSLGYQPNEGQEFNGELIGVAYQPDVGVVAVGSASDPNDPTLDFPVALPAAWVSEDGRSWVRHDIDEELRLRGVKGTSLGLIAHGVSTLRGSPSQDGALLVSIDGEIWQFVAGPFDGLGDIDGVQAINTVTEIPGVGVLAAGSDEKDFEVIGSAAVWWSSGDLTSWEREVHDDSVFDPLDTSPSATMTDAVWADELLVVVGFSGRSIELPGGASACCVIEPAIWIWPER